MEMEKFETLEEVAVFLLNHGPFARDSFETIADVVDATRWIGDRVQYPTEAGLFLDFANFDPAFLRSPINAEDSPDFCARFADERDSLLGMAQEVIHCVKKTNGE